MRDTQRERPQATTAGRRTLSFSRCLFRGVPGGFQASVASCACCRTSLVDPFKLYSNLFAIHDTDRGFGSVWDDTRRIYKSRIAGILPLGGEASAVGGARAPWTLWYIHHHQHHHQKTGHPSRNRCLSSPRRSPARPPLGGRRTGRAATATPCAPGQGQRSG